MKNKIYNALFTALVAVSLSAVLLVTGCSVFAGPDAPGLAGAGGKKAAKTGTLNLSVKGPGGAGASGRTIMPQVVYTAVLTPGTGAPTTVTVYDGNNVLALAPETYDIEVTATNGVNDVIVASGSDSGIEVKANEPVAASVTLTPNGDLTGQGRFEYDLSLFLPHIDSTTQVVTGTIEIFELPVTLTGFDIAGLTAEETVTLDSSDDREAFVGGVDLDAGDYLVAFKIGDTEWNEVLWIAAGLTSYYVPTFETFENPSGDLLVNLMIQSIAEGEYAVLTEHEFVAVDIKGVDKDSIFDIKDGIVALVTSETLVPDDINDLKVLVDAILIRVGAIGVDPTDQTAATAEIQALAQNGTSPASIDVSWSAWNAIAEDYTVTITVGPYEFSVNILPVAEPEFIEVLSLAQAYAVYQFNLPAGATYGDYKAIKAKFKMDATNLALDGRPLRLMGDYGRKLASFVPDTTNDNYLLWAFEASNADYIYDVGTTVPASLVADEWFTLTYKLVGNSANNTTTDKYPANDSAGPFYFGIGIPAAGNEGSPVYKEQQVKNITLVHKSDPRKNVILDAFDFFGFVGKSDVASNYAHGSSRTYIENDDYDGDPTTFDLDLEQWFQPVEEDDYKSGAYSNAVLAQQADYDDGVVTITFIQGYRPTYWIPLSTEQKALVDAAGTAGSIKVIIKGEDVSEADNYRYALASPNPEGNTWQITNLPSGTIASFAKTQILKLTAAGDERTGYLVLQQNTTIAEGDNHDVTISSIKFKVVK